MSDPFDTGYLFPDPTSAPDDLVAFGADLDVSTLLAAYRSGYFPMRNRRPKGIAWYSPNPRGVLEPHRLRISRSLRRSCRHFDVTINTAFDEVVHACGDPRRPHGWIDRSIKTAYGRLHQHGWAHSIEVRREGRLVGGLYGVAIGNLFAGESMFHTETDASKVALVALVERLSADALIDVQWNTAHLASLGVIDITRSEYLRRLRLAVGDPRPLLW